MASLGTFNVYLFDGPHAYQDHYDGLVHAAPALTRQFILIIDDWNWEPVRLEASPRSRRAICR